MHEASKQFIKALQDIAQIHRGPGWIEFLPDLVIEYGDRYLEATTPEEIDNIILSMQELCHRIAEIETE